MLTLLKVCFSVIASIIGLIFGPLVHALIHVQDFLEDSLPKPLNHITVTVLQMIAIPLLVWPVSLPLVAAALFAFWGRVDSFVELMGAGSPALAFVVLRLAWGVYCRSVKPTPDPHRNDVCWAERMGYASVCLCAVLLLCLVIPPAQPLGAKLVIFAFYEWICYLSLWVAACPSCPQF